MAAKVKHYAAWIPLKQPREVHRFIPSEFFYTKEHVLYQKEGYSITFLFMYNRGL